MSEIVLFDFGGTLDADGLPWSTRFHAAYHQAGGALHETAFAAAFRSSDEALAATPGIVHMGFRATVETQAVLLSSLLPGAPDLRAVAESFYRESVATVERNRAVLDALVADGTRLGVISNFTGNLEACLAELGVRDYFEHVADSAITGFAKPDTRIFTGVLDAMRVTADRCWMVGDNPYADIRPAASLGMRTAWLAPRRRALPDGIVSTVRLTSLTALPRAIQNDERTYSRSR